MYKMPENVIENGFLSDIHMPRKSIAFLMDKTENDQMAYEIIKSVHKFCPNEIDVCLFTQEASVMPLTPTTGVFFSELLPVYRGHLISYSISSLIDALKLNTEGKKILYIRDVVDLSKYHSDMVNEIMSRPDIIKVCASENYAKMIKQSNPSAIIEEEIVEDFDILGFLEIIERIENDQAGVDSRDPVLQGRA
tara:strand:+ start:177 stop:755 length:579 start_codon:yes stop_codon:yes gene_type:complete